MKKRTRQNRAAPVAESTDDTSSKEDSAEEVANGEQKAAESPKKGRQSGRKQKPKDQENGNDSDANEDATEDDAGAADASSEGSDESPPEPKRKKSSVKGGKKAAAEETKSPKKAKPETNEESKTPKKGKSETTDESKASKKAKPDTTEETEEDSKEEDAVYEVEAIIDDKKVRKQTQYRIRWKGYNSNDDTWEPEHTLNCKELLQKYKEAKKKKEEEEGSESEEEKVYEVERILEVHFKRDGKREFLVLWKGYSQNESTWESEDRMDCKDLIEKFMARVNKAKSVDQRNLRENRAPTQRFTLSSDTHGRRLSKRHGNKQRVRYVDCE